MKEKDIIEPFGFQGNFNIEKEKSPVLDSRKRGWNHFRADNPEISE